MASKGTTDGLNMLHLIIFQTFFFFIIYATKYYKARIYFAITLGGFHSVGSIYLCGYIKCVYTAVDTLYVSIKCFLCFLTDG